VESERVALGKGLAREFSGADCTASSGFFSPRRYSIADFRQELIEIIQIVRFPAYERSGICVLDVVQDRRDSYAEDFSHSNFNRNPLRLQTLRRNENERFIGILDGLLDGSEYLLAAF